MAELVPPPRAVPANLRRKVGYGGIMQQVGWIMVVVGLLVTLPMVGCTDVASVWKFRGQIDSARGTVVKEDWTHTKVNGRYVREVTYRFTGPDGQEQGGVSYGLGVDYHKGEGVTVEYPHDDPGFSRIRGMRRRILPAFVLLLASIPMLVGLVLGLIGRLSSRRKVGLLAKGVLTRGRLIGKEATNVRVNGAPVYRMMFEFQVGNQTYKTIAKTLEPRKLMDEAMEPLLYDPRNPSHAVMIDSLPGSPRIDERGQLTSEGPAFSYVMAPLLAVSLIVVFVVMNLVM